MNFTLRQYQTDAIAALHNYICTKPTNPCVVLPTGSGKSVVMAGAIEKWRTESPWVRGCVLAHRKELVEQNADKLRSALPDGEVGIFSAGLGQKDYTAPILFASIDSIHKKSGEFAPFDFLFVDEAHRIPPSGEGKYRSFIDGCTRFNKNLRVIGWTATAYRMNCGPICHADHILNEVCYEAGMTDLIKQGFLSNLRSKVGIAQPDLEGVRRNSGGDYIVKSLSAAAGSPGLVGSTIAEAVRIMGEEKRRSAVFFCVDVDHCDRVSDELERHGINAPTITGKTKRHVRDRLIQNFKAQKIRAICCVNVLTEGFDAPHVDTIVLLRPTLSAGLFSQMVGRGLRIWHQKDYCLVLDFAGCIDEHGPLDLLGTGQETVMAVCGDCRESFSRIIRVCPACGWKIPKREVDRMEAEEAERRMHANKASRKAILSHNPEPVEVHNVFVARHRKPGSPDSIKVTYRCGNETVNEWICLDHPGHAGRIADKWWKTRFGGPRKAPSVDEALDLILVQAIKDWTHTITFKKEGKYKKIIAYNHPMEAVDVS